MLKRQQATTGDDRPVGTAAGDQSPLLPLQARGLVLERDGRHLIDNLDLTIHSHAVTVILGANGSGKTLLLRLLHGLITPHAGTIRWGGEDLTKAVRLRQAMVFQRPVLLRRSVAANIDFALALRGHRSPDRRDALLDHVGLAARAGQSARQLSGGEQQRLALARALATEPDVLFLDEPTANLDPASVLMIENIVTAAHRSGTKIIFVTHDIAQARRLGGDIVFLDGGRVIEHRAAEDFFAAPATESAQAYLDGRLVAGGAKLPKGEQ